MAAAGRSAAEGRQLRLAFFLPLVATPTEISACKPNEAEKLTQVACEQALSGVGGAKEADLSQQTLITR